MPNISIPLPEVDKSITRPSVFSIVRQVMEITGIPKDTPILYKGHSDGQAQQGSVIGTEKEEKTLIDGDSFLMIEVIEKFDENYVNSTAVTQTEYPPFIVDNNLSMMIRPVYSHNEYEINITYRSASRTAVLKWRDDIRTKTSQMRTNNMHEISYHYGVPDAFLVIMAEIHRLRENVMGYGQTFEDYFRDCASSRFTQLATMDGRHKEYVVAESMMQIEGYYNFQVAPEEITRGKHQGLWEAQFSYNFSFDKPIEANMVYPVMVHNQLLDMKYIPEPAYDNEIQDKSRSMSLSYMAGLQTTAIRSKYLDHELPLRLPEHDEFAPTSLLPGVTPYVTALCSIMENDKRWIASLDELNIDTQILEFISKYETSFITKPYKSIFHISAFRWNRLINYRDIMVGKDLKIRTFKDMNLRDNHRVMFSLVHDIHSLDNAALQRLSLEPEVMMKVFASLRISKGERKKLALRFNLLSYFENLPDTGDSFVNLWMNTAGMSTVGTQYVQTERAGLNN